jgi:hypothetical protein
LIGRAKPRNIALEFVLVSASGDDMKTLKDYKESGILNLHVSVTCLPV